MTVEIYNGSSWTDISAWIEYQGITFSRNDIDAPDAGRTLDGVMHRHRVASKERMDIKTIPLIRANVQTLQSLLYPETIQVRVNPHPETNSTKLMNMYSNSIKTNHILHRPNGEDLQSMSFPLIEV